MNPLRWLWREMFGDDDSPPEPDQLVLLGEADGEALAGFWQNTLESANIKSMARNVSSLAVYGLPQIEMLVQFKDLERARQLLDLHDDSAGGEASWRDVRLDNGFRASRASPAPRRSLWTQ